MSSRLRIWPFLVLALAAVPAAFFSCMTPFGAVAALCATTMRSRAAYGVMTAVWIIDQARVFVYLRCAPTQSSVGWGIAMLAVALATVALLSTPGAERLIRDDARPLTAFGKRAAAFVAAFALQEVAYYAISLYLGGSDLFTPAIVRALGSVGAIWFLAASAVYAGIAASGRPATRSIAHR